MKKIIKCLSMAIFALVVAIGSFLIPKYYNKQSLLVASADNVVTEYAFNGSNIYVPLWRNLDTATYMLDTLLFRTSFISSSSSVNFDISMSKDYVSLNSNRYNYVLVDVYTNSARTSQSFSYDLSSAGTYQGVSLYAYDGTTFYYSMFCYISNQNFTANIYKIRLYWDRFAINNDTQRWNMIEYYDVNDNFVRFCFVNYEGYQTNSNFNDRTYFLNTELSDTQQYNQGYQEGLSANQQNIYDNGYSAGNSIGYSNGYSAGVASANNYTFVGLIGSVIDVPVKTLMGLLNFEVLGINLFGFLTGLLTFALIIFIIKLILGGK